MKPPRDLDGKAPITECFGELNARLAQLKQGDPLQILGQFHIESNIEDISGSIFHYPYGDGIRLLDQCLETISFVKSNGPPKNKRNTDTNDSFFTGTTSLIPTTEKDKEVWQNELNFYETKIKFLHQTLSEENTIGAGTNKFDTDLSVEELSLLTRLLAETGAINLPKTKTILFEKVAANFQSKQNKGQISTNSIKKYYDQPTDRAKSKMHLILTQALKDLKSLT